MVASEPDVAGVAGLGGGGATASGTTTPVWTATGAVATTLTPRVEEREVTGWATNVAAEVVIEVARVEEVLVPSSGMVRVASTLMLEAERVSSSRQAGGRQPSSASSVLLRLASWAASKEVRSPPMVRLTSTTVAGTETMVVPSGRGENGGWSG